MAKTISRPSTPRPIPSHGTGGKIVENNQNGTGPRAPEGE